VCVCVYVCFEGFTTMVANEGLEKTRAYLNQVPWDQQLYVPSNSFMSPVCVCVHVCACVCVCAHVHVCVCVCVVCMVCVWVCSKPGYAALSVNILELRELIVLVPQLREKVLCLVYVLCTFVFEITWSIFRVPPFLFECEYHSYCPTDRIYDHN